MCRKHYAKYSEKTEAWITRPLTWSKGVKNCCECKFCGISCGEWDLMIEIKSRTK